MSSPYSDATRAAAARAISSEARPLRGESSDFDPVLALAGDAHYVLLGESSHGTHDFYRVRAELTKRLIRERGFTGVAIEGDWPEAHRVNRYVHGLGDDPDAEASLAAFGRFPQWMWRNADVLDFVGWLRAWNEAHAPEGRSVGFYGLDLYSMHASMAAVLDFLDIVDTDAAARARHRYACFDHFGDDPQEYGYATAFGLSESCEREVVAQVVELRRSAAEYAGRDGRLPVDALFFAEQNARLVRNAERYYRAMFGGRATSWNLRDQHMAETLDELTAYLARRAPRPRLVVWAHNSHVGDARATEMAVRGELNIGQLVRERHPGDALLVGFTTATGTVTAATDWGGRAERKVVRPPLAGSYEALMHDVVERNFLLDLSSPSAARDVLLQPRLERAIGVIYRPETERISHYFSAVLPNQFDAVLHYDVTRAVEPLERTGTWEQGELPETYPTAL